MARMTNAQLVDENIRLRAQCAVLETKISGLEAEIGTIRSTSREAGQRGESGIQQARLLDFPATRAGYYAYVNARRNACREARKPVSYKTWEQFLDVHHEAIYS